MAQFLRVAVELRLRRWTFRVAVLERAARALAVADGIAGSLELVAPIDRGDLHWSFHTDTSPPFVERSIELGPDDGHELPGGTNLQRMKAPPEGLGETIHRPIR